MATKDNGQHAAGMSRRAFLTTAAVAGAAVGCGLDIAFDPAKASAYENDTTNYKVTNTTCPYCSASCGQRVVVALTGANAGKVVDIYGDFESPMNSGGLCARALAHQLVTNSRRLGAFADSSGELHVRLTTKLHRWHRVSSRGRRHGPR
jgi:anaerobic selenocysteine-containing dehydrogenase